MVLSPTETKVRRAVALIRPNAADLAACRRDAEAALGGMRTTTFFDRRLPENKSVREKSVQAAAALRRLQKALEKNPDLADRLAQVKGLGGDTEWFIMALLKKCIAIADEHAAYRMNPKAIKPVARYRQEAVKAALHLLRTYTPDNVTVARLTALANHISGVDCASASRTALRTMRMVK